MKKFPAVVLGYTVFVILWGAVVRATGSGAGCGEHWPLCNGEVIPIATELKTLIEFSHRLTSGISLLLVVALVFWARKRTQPSDHTRKFVWLSLFFILLEAMIGAGLVMLGLVDRDSSASRAFVIGFHLVNTLALLFALTGVVFYSWKKTPLRWPTRIWWVLTAGIGLMAATGAVTALGDTLFKTGSLLEGVEADFSPASHFLVRLRVLHPFLAMVVGGGLVAYSVRVERLRFGIVVLVALAIGWVNLLLLAPIWTQILHLAMADVLWIYWVWVGFEGGKRGAHSV